MRSKRLIFSHYTELDFDDYYGLVSNADVMKMITGRPLLEDEIQSHFERMIKVNQESGQLGYFKVSLRNDGTFVGHSKLEKTKTYEAEIGYVLRPEFWRKGYGNEIAGTLVNLGREVAEIHNLIAIIDPENTASKRILEKQGFQWDYNGEYIGLPAAYYKIELKSKSKNPYKTR